MPSYEHHCQASNAFTVSGLDRRAQARHKPGIKQAAESSSRGFIVKLLPIVNCGIIQTPDCREIFFHRDNLLKVAFDALRVGAEVRFKEENGDRGPQANRVELVKNAFRPLVYIVVTAQADASEAEQAMAGGARAVLQKPFDIHRLIKHIQQAIRPFLLWQN